MKNQVLGRHVLVEYWNCDRAVLNRPELLRECLLEGVRRSGATIITDVFHQFSPHGVTGVIVIAESHASIHTWPEHGYAAVDVFSCSEEMAIAEIIELLKKSLGSDSVEIREIERGRLPGLTQTGARPFFPASP
jgi:S-adenosylmethionine decarboxylase proenzyme